MSQILWKPGFENKNTRAALRWWRNSYQSQLPPRGFVWILHGMGEHSGRYDEFAKFLNEAGFDVLAPDLPGYGNSATLGGQTTLLSVAEMIEEIEDHQKFWFEQGPLATPGLKNTPWYLVGHSLGGLIALKWILQGKKDESAPDFARRAFISSPALGVKMKVPAWKLKAAALLNQIAPDFKISNGISPEDISRDAAVVRAYRQDPLVHDRVSSRQFFSIEATQVLVLEQARDVEIPLLLSIGDADPIVSSAKVVEFYDKTNTHKKLLRWSGAKHEVLNELERRKLFEEVAGWFL